MKVHAEYCTPPAIIAHYQLKNGKWPVWNENPYPRLTAERLLLGKTLGERITNYRKLCKERALTVEDGGKGYVKVWHKDWNGYDKPPSEETGRYTRHFFGASTRLRHAHGSARFIDNADAQLSDLREYQGKAMKYWQVVAHEASEATWLKIV